MSDSLAVLIDHHATEIEAEPIGKAIVDALIAERCILPVPNADCAIGNRGYPPGPRLNEIYRFGDRELRYWDMLTQCCVTVQATRYVNWHGFPIFEQAVCPGCSGIQTEDESFYDGLFHCVSTFVNDGMIPDVECPTCGKAYPGKQWGCTPDIGIAYLAVEFWNWPPFSARGWETSVPDLIADRTGRRLATSWGRM